MTQIIFISNILIVETKKLSRVIMVVRNGFRKRQKCPRFLIDFTTILINRVTPLYLFTFLFLIQIYLPQSSIGLDYLCCAVRTFEFSAFRCFLLLSSTEQIHQTNINLLHLISASEYLVFLFYHKKRMYLNQYTRRVPGITPVRQA